MITTDYHLFHFPSFVDELNYLFAAVDKYVDQDSIQQTYSVDGSHVSLEQQAIDMLSNSNHCEDTAGLAINTSHSSSQSASLHQSSASASAGRNSYQINNEAKRNKKIKAMMKALNIGADGRHLPLDYIHNLTYGDNTRRLVAKLHRANVYAEKTKRRCLDAVGVSNYYKDIALIHSFVEGIFYYFYYSITIIDTYYTPYIINIIRFIYIN